MVLWGAVACCAPRAAQGQVSVQTSVPGNVVRIESSGQVTVDGHCFGHVGTLPSGPVLNIFGNKAVTVGGNIYVSGALSFSSPSFPGGMVIQSGGRPIASLTSDGNLYAAGTCVNTRGNSNTKWDPDRWNHPPNLPFEHPGNCYSYAVDMQFADPYGRCPGQTSVHDGNGLDAAAQPAGYCPTKMTIRNYTNPATGFTTTGLVERAQADGLVPVGPIYPNTPVAKPNTYDCGGAGENRGHLVFMIVQPSSSDPSGIYADDYHWLRFDQETGTWSFKNGIIGCVVNDLVEQYTVPSMTCVMNGNASGHPIVNPVTFAADSAGGYDTDYSTYTVNVGYFCAPGGHASIQ